MSKVVRKGAYMVLVCLLVLLVATGAFAQRRGRGEGGGHAGSMGNAGGPDRDMGNASNRSRGRSNEDMDNDSMRSNNRSEREEREDRERSNLRHADDDLREHPGVPRALHTNANDLRAGFQAALARNPNLTFGHFVAATRLGQNLHSRFPNITRDAILAGLASGKSLGQTLQALGLSEREEKEARKQVEREMIDARRD